MINHIIDFGARTFIKSKIYRLDKIVNSPIELQQELFKEILKKGLKTDFGKKYLTDVKNYSDFNALVPIHTYDSIKPWFQKILDGAQGVTTSDEVKWFSKSSGTTADQSKYIPITSNYLSKINIGGQDTLTAYFKDFPDSQIWKGKTVVMGGSFIDHEFKASIVIGDVSAIMLDNLPLWSRYYFKPDFKIAFNPNWEVKIEDMANKIIHEDIRFMGGVPSWSSVLFNKMLSITGKEHILEIWPNFELFIHGGVNFGPYLQQFKRFFPSEDVHYREVYNASEGYFATTYTHGDDDMLLLTDNGMFYEFIPFNTYHDADRKCIPLENVEVGVDYVLLITSINGNWRYVIGDVIVFTSTQPYKIKISGRISQFINTFGEEVMVHNTDTAIQNACTITNSIISEYTVAPKVLDFGTGYHEWAVEFIQPPADIVAFTKIVDIELQKLNSDYAAKRHLDLVLGPLKIHILSKGRFSQWMKARNKFGSQYKVPRLSTTRNHLESLLNFDQSINQ